MDAQAFDGRLLIYWPLITIPRYCFDFQIRHIQDISLPRRDDRAMVVAAYSYFDAAISCHHTTLLEYVL